MDSAVGLSQLNTMLCTPSVSASDNFQEWSNNLKEKVKAQRQLIKFRDNRSLELKLKQEAEIRRSKELQSQIKNAEQIRFRKMFANVAKKRTPRQHESIETLLSDGKPIRASYGQKSIAGSNTPSHKNISLIGSRQGDSRNNILGKATRKGGRNLRYLNEETSIFNLEDTAEINDTGTERHNSDDQQMTKIYSTNESKVKHKSRRKKSTESEDRVRYGGNLVTGSVEMNVNRKGADQAIRFKSIKVRKTSLVQKPEEIKNTFLTATGQQALIQKKATTELTQPSSPKPQEQGLKQYILELLEQNRRAEKERLARQINKIDSPRKVKERANSIDTDFKLPVIKGFGFNESPYGKLVKQDEKKAERMLQLQKQFQSVRINLISAQEASKIQLRNARICEIAGRLLVLNQKMKERMSAKLGQSYVVNLSKQLDISNKSLLEPLKKNKRIVILPRIMSKN